MKVLLVEDEAVLREGLDEALKRDGYQVAIARDGVQALQLTERLKPDAMVLDLGLPLLDGIQVCRRLRAQGDRTPILMLTARDGVGDRVEGLDAGGDDYVVKPFALDELLARLRALLRRASPEAGEVSVLRFESLSLDIRRMELRVADEPVRLTRTEYLLLELFLRNPNTVLTRPVIFERVWGYDFGPSSNGLHVYVSYLRRKLEQGGRPRLIHNVRGVGYILRAG